jgi:hypothetical protein
MSADNDPHFIINIKGLDNAVCFDVMGNEGDVYTLVNDKYSGKCSTFLGNVSLLLLYEKKILFSKVRTNKSQHIKK